MGTSHAWSKKTWLRVAGLPLALAAAFASVVFAWQWFAVWPMGKTRTGSSVVVVIAPGMPAVRIVDALQQHMELSCPICVRIAIRYYALSRHFQSGYYKLGTQKTLKSFFEQLLRGDTLQLSFTVVEGETTAVMLRRLQQAAYLQDKQRLQGWFASQCAGCAPSDLEGLFLADTFFYQAGVSAISLLEKSHAALKLALAPQWQASQRQGLPFRTTRQLLTAASIIEKETALADEKPLIAAVIINRLRQGMRLQMDPCVIYGLGQRYRFPLTKRDLHEDTPFNTYRHYGLPPHPIANVSVESLRAAAHPAAVSFLYYYSADGQRHHFSNTLDEQQQWIHRH